MWKLLELSRAAAVAVSIAVVGLTLPAAAQKQGGTLVLAFQSDVSIFNNIADAQFGVHMIASNIYNMLIHLDADGRAQPELAESWDFADGGKTVTFHLREGVKFHDGHELTSEDVQFTMEKAMPYHARARAFWLPLVDSIETPDDYTVVIHLKEPFAPILALLGTPLGGAMILPKHIYEPYMGSIEEFRGAPPSIQSPVGTGPFIFQEHVKGDHVTLLRNPDYWDAPKPYADRLVIRFISDNNARLSALETGEIDFLYSNVVPWDRVTALRADPRFTVLDIGETGTAQISYLLMNGFREITGNPKVRQALAYAIDRQQIVDFAASGIATVADGITHSKTTWAFDPVYAEYRPDLDKARALLDEAGYPLQQGTRFKLTMLVAQGSAPEAATAEVVRQQLRAIGVDVVIEAADRATALRQVFFDKQYDLFVQAIVSGPDPKMGVSALYDANNRGEALFNNTGNFENARVQELLEQEWRTPDETQRGAIWREIAELVSAEVPILPLYELPWVHTHSARWADVVTQAIGSVQSRADAYLK